jgi:hypothetical protein
VCNFSKKGKESGLKELANELQPPPSVRIGYRVKLWAQNPVVLFKKKKKNTLILLYLVEDLYGGR